MIFKSLSIALLLTVLSGCSFENKADRATASYRVDSSSLKGTEFNRAKIYDWACLAVRGFGVERSAWTKIESDSDSLSAEFKIPNLLGGYTYTFTILAVDTDNPNLDKGVLSSPCPVDLPEKEGWAQLGRTDVEMPEKAKGAFKVEIPFNFDQPVLLVPGKPMNLQAVSGNESVSLTWDDPEVDGGGDISEYVIQYSPGSGSTTTSGNSTTISGLTNGVSYTFRVAAKNSAGQGLFTTAVTATPSPVSVTLSSSTPSPTNSDISVTATFGTPVTGFELGDISVTNGTAKNFSGSGSSYAFQVTPAGSPVTISVPSGKAQGPNSISNTASNVLNRIFDATSPTVALSSDSSSGDTIVTATFSEEVTGFELGDVAVTNGTKDNFSGSGTTYTFRVALSSGAASMIITVPAGVAEDAAGNGNISASITLNTVSPQPPPNPPAAAPCSGSCYEDSIAKANGSATGPDGVEMEYLQADPNCVPTKAQPCFKIWRENNLLNGQKRILNASGLVVHGWQKILDRKGLGFSGDDLNPDNIKLIEGRVCPNNVFLDYNNMNAASRCVYYTSTISNAKLNDYSQGTPFEDFLENWNQEVSGAGQGSSYYEGNIRLCGDLGMRLPTVYEVNVDSASIGLNFVPNGDLPFQIIWAGSTGVPSGSTFTWTASAARDSRELTERGSQYFSWISTEASGLGAVPPSPYTDSKAIRCILPNSALTPRAPTGLNAQGSTNLTILVWTKPYPTVGPEIQKYYIERSVDEGVTWIQQGVVEITPGSMPGPLNYNYEGFSGTVLTFRVVAENANGKGLYSNRVTFLVP